MKKVFTISHFLIHLVAIPAFCQESVNAGGGEAAGSGGTVSYSLGQVVYTQISGNSYTMDQGVQHAYEVLTLGNPIPASGFSLNVFPNPCTEFLMLNTQQPLAGDLRFQLSDLQSKIIRSGQVISSQTHIDFSALPPAVYFLNITSNNQPLQTFKIIKK